eukprot:7969992-Pyramimonas_sp.AAC.1
MPRGTTRQPAPQAHARTGSFPASKHLLALRCLYSFRLCDGGRGRTKQNLPSSPSLALAFAFAVVS